MPVVFIFTYKHLYTHLDTCLNSKDCDVFTQELSYAQNDLIKRVLLYYLEPPSDRMKTIITLKSFASGLKTTLRQTRLIIYDEETTTLQSI